MTDLPADLDPEKLVSARDEAVKKAEKATKELTKVTQDGDRLRDEVKDLKARLNTTTKRLGLLETKLKELDAVERFKERDSLRHQTAVAQSAAAKAEKASVEKDALVVKKEKEVKALKRKIEQADGTMVQIQRGRNGAMEREKAALKRESDAIVRVKGFEEKIAKLTKDFETAGKEKADLEREVKALRRTPASARR